MGNVKKASRPSWQCYQANRHFFGRSSRKIHFLHTLFSAGRFAARTKKVHFSRIWSLLWARFSVRVKRKVFFLGQQNCERSSCANLLTAYILALGLRFSALIPTKGEDAIRGQCFAQSTASAITPDSQHGVRREQASGLLNPKLRAETWMQVKN